MKKLLYKSMLRVMCMITLFCLVQVLPVINHFRPREIINITQVQPNLTGLQEIIKKAAQSCVMIEVHGPYDYNYQPIKWLGSGVIVSENGVIVTAGHVVKNAIEIKVILADGREYKAKSFEYETITDVGIIKIDANDLPILSFGDSNKCVLGDTVIAIGSPFGKTLFNTVTVGIISGLQRDIPFFGNKLLFQIDAATAPGKSGGGVFDAQGNFIGIMVGMLRDYDDISLCVPSNIIELVVSKYCEEKNFENAE
ncbi:MAG TPA: trypsin-like serine protease [bacterium]|nr:trypsin-like serine protease [bacterium]